MVTRNGRGPTSRIIRTRIGLAALLAILLFPQAAQPEITPTTTASDLAAAIAFDPSVVSGAAFVAVPPTGTPNAVSTTALAGFPTVGSSYAILTSGNATLADDANTAGGSGASLGGANVRGNTDFDVTILRIDLNVPTGSNCLTFDFRFLSEEYPEYVGSAFNDAFIAELDNSTWTTSGSTISAPNNFAFDPSGDVISVNSSGQTSMSAANAAGTTYDGATPLLSASTPITAGAHSLYLSIFDQGDRILDSAVFVDNLVIGTVGPGGCQSGATALSTSKTADSATSAPGAANGYTITVSNPTATAVTLNSISDALPAGFTYVAGSTTGATTANPAISGQTLTWAGPFTVPAAGSVSLHFNVVVATAPGEYLNNASADAGAIAVAPTGPTAKITVSGTTATADLSVAKADAPDPVTVGDNVTYTITVTNNGPVAADGVIVTDALPAGATLVSASASQGSCSGTTTVSCSLGSLANGASATVTIVVTTTAVGPLSNTATAAATTADPSSANNSATATTTVNPPPSADLSIAKTDAPDPVNLGGTVTYTITVTNNGPDAAAGTTVSDTLPAGAALVSATATQGTCSGTTTVSCSLGSLASGATATVTLVVEATAGGTLSNTATVAASTADPNMANNSATAVTTVNRPPSCADVVPSTETLWPPNSKFVLVALSGATDPDQDPVTLAITGVTQDEPVAKKEPDATAGANGSEVWLRAQREGTGDGRVYRIAFTVSDPHGATCSAVIVVSVPHDIGQGSTAVDSGGSFDSFGGETD
jgi:uncharacterized repeat protein (TIGR01451 family)